ncbi:MAG: DNA polymerase III subunit delta [Firmicutes bacterium]|nr:DNA polymerase III subunit delta [Candidatus Fermentithermobacillaceae bacterium]
MYFIYGDEAYWHDRLIGLLSDAFPDGTEHLSGDETSWHELQDLMAQASFFGPRLWVVRGAKPLFDQKQERWITAAAPGNCLLLSAVTKTNPAPKAFTRAVSQIGGAVIKVAEPSWREASNWVRERLRADGFTITRDALENLILVAGRSMERLDKEIEKLELFVRPETRITAGHVAACVSPDPQMNTFAFVDAVATKDRAKAFSEVDDLRLRGVSPVFMIAVLGSHFGLMWRAKDSANKGIAQDSLGEPLGAHPYAARKALEQSRRWTFPQLEQAIRLLCDVDESLKTGKTDPVSAMDYVLANLFAE